MFPAAPAMFPAESPSPEAEPLTDERASSALPMILSLTPTPAPFTLSTWRRAMAPGVTASPRALTFWLRLARVCSISVRSSSGLLLVVMCVIPRFP